MKKKEVTAKSYTLRTDDNSWLGSVVLTTNGSFMSITEYGNFAYNWNSTGCEDFREFLLKINIDYFGQKMFNGMCYISSSQQIRKSAMLFSEKILPTLQKVLRKELESERT